MDNPTYEMITSIGTLLFVFFFLRRMFHPFHCACGYLTWRAQAFIRHVEMKHVLQHGGGK